MGSEGRRTVRRPQGEYVCSTCGQPVGSVIKRRKVLGVFVPEWDPGPCHNPDCARGSDDAPGAGREAGREREADGTKGTSEEPADGSAKGSSA
ncbi:hypothetical protein ACIQMR_30650 [Streptomyces sp. NPDC091376]|uniref:hypothetical protein n=1 Tax=Streptomyces sp. NPDC091376 TaxID=3365994 RepID=UPI00382DC85F